MPEPRFKLLRWGWRLLVLALMTGGWALAAAALHVVVVPRTAPTSAGEVQVLVLPKDRLSFAHTYVDTRAWTLADAHQHDALVSRMVEAGHAQRLSHVLPPELQKRLEEMLRVRRGVLDGR